MVKLGKVRVKRIVEEDNYSYNWLANVKISVLKRLIGNEDYPETIGIEVFTDVDGKYHIAYDGDRDFKFFLKPEKEGYYYERYGEFDYKDFPNSDPGYIINGSFSMDKENK